MANFIKDPNFQSTGILSYGEHKYFISRRPQDFLKPSPFMNLVIEEVTGTMERVGI